MKQAATEKPQRHPAKFTDVILKEAERLLTKHVMLGPRRPTMYDPFAGTGKGVDYFNERGWCALGTELEREWATQSTAVINADSLRFMRDGQVDWAMGPVDVVFTSPCYGNRMADHHAAKDTSKRNTYRHALERELTEGNAGGMQWGEEYRSFHRETWRLVFQVVRPGGLFLLNIKDHIRKGEQVHVSEWHRETALAAGFEQVTTRWVEVPSNRFGQNHAARVDGEWLFLFQKP